MKILYNLVKLKKELSSKLDEITLRSEIKNRVNLLDNIVQTYTELPNLSLIEDIKNSYSSLLENDQQNIDRLTAFIDHLSGEIEHRGRHETNSDKFIEETMHHQMILDDKTQTKIISKISQYSSALYPGLQILAREKQWIVPMVTCDPLYLTRNKLDNTFYKDNIIYYEKIVPAGSRALSISTENTDPALKMLEVLIEDYPDIYKRRVGLYTIENRDFSILPQNQFGFVLCWDNFDYLNGDIIQKYLQEVFRLLRPGGVFMFSYTNCEVELSALKVDYQTAAYCSSTWLSTVLTNIGYEIISLIDCVTTESEIQSISWAEVRKPGTLSTSKLSQARGQILTK